jgi:hypothetical protein
MKSLQDIKEEFFDQRDKKDAKLRAKLSETLAEKDALLQRAGITDGSIFGDDADRWTDDDYYRRRVREQVFNVSDFELRTQIMLTISNYRYAMRDRLEMRHSFEEAFATRLRHERCQRRGSQFLISVIL